MALFCYLCPINSSLDLHGPVSNVPHSLVHRPAQFSGCTKNPIFGAHSSCNQRLCGPGNVQFFASRNRRVPFLLSFDQSNRSITETINSSRPEIGVSRFCWVSTNHWIVALQKPLISVFFSQAMSFTRFVELDEKARRCGAKLCKWLRKCMNI